MNELFVLDPSNKTWSDLTNNISGPRPSPRSGHGFASADNKLFVFGGGDIIGKGGQGESAHGVERKDGGVVFCEGQGAQAWLKTLGGSFARLQAVFLVWILVFQVVPVQLFPHHARQNCFEGHLYLYSCTYSCFVSM